MKKLKYSPDYTEKMRELKKYLDDESISVIAIDNSGELYCSESVRDKIKR